MGLKDEWCALDGGGVGTFATLSDALLDEFLGIGQERDPLTGVALAAEIVGEALAIGGLSEHPRQCEFADAARTGEEQSVRYAPAAERAAQGGDDALIAEEFGEAHQRAPEFDCDASWLAMTG
jgi:hypothetical protein